MPTKRDKRISRDNRTHEEIYHEPALLPSLIRNAPETATWLSKDKVRLIRLVSDTKEYQLQAARFNKTLTKKNKNCILRIERIENPSFMAGFVLKRYELKAMIPKMQVHTRTMFHATSRVASNKIIAHNFDWRLSGKKKGDKWGHGISFSPYSDFAAKFTREESNGCTMFLCLMLERHTHYGSVGLEVPDDDFDTTQSTDGKVFVKFDDYTVYPAYRITYCK